MRPETTPRSAVRPEATQRSAVRLEATQRSAVRAAEIRSPPPLAMDERHACGIYGAVDEQSTVRCASALRCDSDGEAPRAAGGARCARVYSRSGRSMCVRRATVCRYFITHPAARLGCCRNIPRLASRPAARRPAEASSRRPERGYTITETCRGNVSLAADDHKSWDAP